MSTPAIQSVVQQMHTLAGVTDNTGLRGQNVTTAVGQGGFAEELQNSIQRINQMKVESEQQIRAFEAGSTSVSLNDVMVDMQKASVAMEAGIQVRNRLVSAYKEIMAMQI